MSDSIKELTEKIRKFCDERDWSQFHNQKDLASALAVESAELQELFLWKSEKQIKETMSSSKREKVEEELADVLYYILRFADMSDINPGEALSKKLKQNEKKYPVEKSKGNNLKYTELE